MVSAPRYDVVIIGAGHNGLVAAAYLSRAGRSVMVLERRPVIGGACVTEEVWPGYRVSTAAYLCGLLHPGIIRDLRLDALEVTGFAFRNSVFLLQLLP